jgi:hypothetical protein
MGFFDKKHTPIDHKCEGAVYYKGCLGCASRLLASTSGNERQSAVMLEYLTKYHGHDPQELIALQQASLKTSA